MLKSLWRYEIPKCPVWKCSIGWAGYRSAETSAAAGFPVMIEETFMMEESYWPNDDRWAGHYLLVTDTMTQQNLHYTRFLRGFQLTRQL
jgi:hypothetical protein